MRLVQRFVLLCLQETDSVELITTTGQAASTEDFSIYHITGDEVAATICEAYKSAPEWVCEEPELWLHIRKS